MRSSRAVMLFIVIVSWLVAGTVAGASSDLQGLRTAVDQRTTTFFLRIPTPVHYTPAWVGSRIFALDIADVSTRRSSESLSLRSPLVSTYRLLSYQGAGGKPHLRLEVALKREAKVDARQTRGGLEIRFQGGSAQALPSELKASPANSQALPATLPRGTVIREIQVAKLEGSSALEVEIVGNGTFEYRTMRLTNPERLVVDIPNVHNQMRQRQLQVNASPLRAVRVGQLSRSPLISRVVMDLDSKTPFQVRPQSDALVVTIGESGAEGAGNGAAGKSTPPMGSSPEEPTRAEPTKAEPTEALSAANSAPLNMDRGEPDGSENRLSQLPAAMPANAGKVEEENATSSLPSRSALPELPQPDLAPSKQPAKATGALPPEAALLPAPETGAATQPLPPSPGSEMAVAKVDVVTQPLSSGRGSEMAAAMVDVVTQPLPPSPGSEMVVAKADVAASPEAKMVTPVHQAPPERVVEPAFPAKLESSAAVIAQNPAPSLKTFLAQQTAPPAVAPAATPPAGLPTQRPAYTGEPVSVNLKDVDLKDFFRLIHEISGLNIVLDPTVSGTVTVVLDEIPWDQAMEIVMRNNGLGREVEGNVVRIAKLSTLEAEKKQQTDLAAAAELAQPRITATRTLSYAKATDMILTLRRFLTMRGDIVPDLRTNTVIITDIPDRIEQIDRLIRILDQKSQQVEIEARVVSASRSFARDIGMQLAASGLTGNVVLGGTGVVGTSPAATRGRAPGLLSGTTTGGTTTGGQPLITNFQAAGPSSGFTFLLTGGNTFALDAIITAAESKGIGKLLSRPKIITQNNVEATVKQGVKIPLQTTINNTISIQYVDVVLRLTVTPQITADGTIFLKTDIENTTIDPGIATTPGQFGLDTQSAITSVLVSNGGTVFFGGVIQNINRVSESQVPLLGSVPLVGNLFKHKSTTSTTNELLFFITPRIVQS